MTASSGHLGANSPLIGILLALAWALFPPSVSAEPGHEGWQLLRAPGFWEKEFGGTIESHDGYAWYRCFVKVPSTWRGKTLTLELGPIDDCDETFFNGVQVGGLGTREPFKTASGVPRRYQVDPKHVRAGAYNLIAVRVFDHGGAGGFGGTSMAMFTPGGDDENSALQLNGNWQFRIDDDPNFAKWPAGDPAGARKLAHAFVGLSASDLGKPVKYELLPGTKALTMRGDIASQLVDGADRFLLREIEASVAKREAHWKRDFSSGEAYDKSIAPNRARLSDILGMRDGRQKVDALQYVSSTTRDAVVAKAGNYDVFAVRWPAAGNMHGEGLLLAPRGRKPVAYIVAIPDADQTPEQLCGMAEGVAPHSQFPRQLAENGCQVVVPMLVSRARGQFSWHGRKHGLTHREFLYRTAYELGRHLIGYELHKVLAVVDYFKAQSAGEEKAPGIGVYGFGEGGMLALYAGALDPRIDAAVVSGHFQNRNTLWRQPLDRNVFGLFEQFGDAELAAMVAPRKLIVEAGDHPAYELPPGTGGGGPAKLVTPDPQDIRNEADRARALLKDWAEAKSWLTLTGDGKGAFGREDTARALFAALAPGANWAAPAVDPPKPRGEPTPPDARLERQMREIDRHTQAVLRESQWVRKSYMSKLNTKSIADYEKSVEHYRNEFRHEVIGHFDHELLPPNVRTRKMMETEAVTYYEVVLDVFPDLIAYGILCLPRDLKEGERRPVVVCQHGLEGRPQSVIGEKDYHYYKAFATKLAERGFVTFAPQNLYIFQDRFRTLQRKAYPLKKTLYSMIVPQHQQIVDWLQSQPFVDPERVAFYGLSYGGKTAMRVPPLVTDYCLSICSADFNEWVDKNASTRNPRSYVWGGEYEIFEWDLGSTFNYAEMAALIAPRPFMVERGHYDGVADDWTVGWEFAKVRNLYQARLKIGDRCEIEWFDGPHAINEQATYRFLHRHLNWLESRN